MSSPILVLLTGSTFRALVSGQKRGVLASCARGLFSAAEVPYSLAIRWRNSRFDRGIDVHRVTVPVVSVGNLTLGGTGKTPLVEWIARWYRSRGVRVGLVSRGYGAQAGGRNDEARELEQKLPDVPHVQNRDRVAGARLAIDEFESQLILLDDGFQHRRLARDLDIVVVDALEPFGLGHLFPRGTLREPISGLARADIVVLSRADLIELPERRAIQERAANLAPKCRWLEARHAPCALRSASQQQQPVASLVGLRVAAFCGIGNPLGFRRVLEGLQCRLVDFREFPDHHAYTREDVGSLNRWSDSQAIDAVLTTHKDLVKLEIDRLGSRPLWALQIGIEFLSGQDVLEAELARSIVKATAVASAFA